MTKNDDGNSIKRYSGSYTKQSSKLTIDRLEFDLMPWEKFGPQIRPNRITLISHLDNLKK